MTILSRNNAIGCDIRLTFGVPLEDVFPDGDIHPSLKNLFLSIYEALYFSREPIEIHLSDDQQLSVGCLPLLVALERCEPIDLMPLETLFSGLRHYLSSLPLPLLPKYTDGRHFVWQKLGQRCQQYMQAQIKAEETNLYLMELLTDELLKLPAVNLLLIGYLMNFFRSLIAARDGKLRRKSANALINYFWPSFLQKSGRIQQPCRSLIFYILIKWPELQLRCVQKSPLCFARYKRKLSLEVIKESNELEGFDVGSESLVREETIGSVSSDSFVTSPDIDCRDVASQTDPEVSKSTTTQTILAKSFGESVSTQTSLSDDIKESKSSGFKLCCQSVSTQIEETFFKSSPKSSQESDNSYVKFSDDDDYIFDDDYKRKSDLAARVSQIGWTYTPPTKDVKSDWKIPKDDYKICFDQKEAANNGSFEECNVQTPLNATKNRGSFSNFSVKLKSKLDLLKIFKDRRVRKSASDEKVAIKYQKMDGARSTLF